MDSLCTRTASVRPGPSTTRVPKPKGFQMLRGGTEHFSGISLWRPGLPLPRLWFAPVVLGDISCDQKKADCMQVLYVLRELCKKLGLEKPQGRDMKEEGCVDFSDFKENTCPGWFWCLSCRWAEAQPWWIRQNSDAIASLGQSSDH